MILFVFYVTEIYINQKAKEEYMGLSVEEQKEHLNSSFTTET